MNHETLDAYLLSKHGVSFDYPFDQKVRVYRVGGKIFALMGDTTHINLKCHPLYALELRALYTSIDAGYHMNKKHWNTITLNGDVDATLLQELIDHSYDLVLHGLSQKVQRALQEG